ncbi:uncharacterized protein TNCV_4598581 [Trichonephila clavipes]|nr:uncharacterized protein TNCV_4598581 [Trichonephila clavipes]
MVEYKDAAQEEGDNNSPCFRAMEDGFQPCHIPGAIEDPAAVAEWYRYRIMACLVTSSSPVPLKTRRVGQRCTLNLLRVETSSRCCGVVARRGDVSSVARLKTKIKHPPTALYLLKTLITLVPFWKADTGHHMGERNVLCDPTPGWGEVTKCQESSWRMRTRNDSSRINGHTMMKDTANENDSGRLVDGESPVRGWSGHAVKHHHLLQRMSLRTF